MYLRTKAKKSIGTKNAIVGSISPKKWQIFWPQYRSFSLGPNPETAIPLIVYTTVLKELWQALLRIKLEQSPNFGVE